MGATPTESTSLVWERVIEFVNTPIEVGKNRDFIDLARNALLEFGDVADFVWKSPRLLDSETALEEKKLKTYFPLSGQPEKDELSTKLRTARWASESKKLENLFPRLIGTGNLFSALALLEAYCLRLGKLIEQQASCRMQDVKGQGISRIFKFYSMVGINYKALQFYEQLDCALKIRNCLIHAEGLLSWSRDEPALRKIVRERTYLQMEMRTDAAAKGATSSKVTIFDDGIGDRIKITNDYAFDVVWYAKNYVIAAAEAAHISNLAKSELQA